ncbi:putative ATPase [Acanthamoeba polyphaga mimivirus]|uniref:ATPase n=1 Tax=Acanthamoeba polyphaga mimivirus Kroon TaxID=3069720 RepID=A0A0G2Y739_9VIRU|nr:putative ATPase [Acanthamoeba polyphaga mimivirus]AKI80404.1 putative ATPase [Acanthamoeba polyphaga mimivirus Kroon]
MVGIQDFSTNLIENNQAIMIIGPKYTGKTTLIERLVNDLCARKEIKRIHWYKPINSRSINYSEKNKFNGLFKLYNNYQSIFDEYSKKNVHKKPNEESIIIFDDIHLCNTSIINIFKKFISDRKKNNVTIIFSLQNFGPYGRIVLPFDLYFSFDNFNYMANKMFTHEFEKKFKTTYEFKRFTNKYLTTKYNSLVFDKHTKNLYQFNAVTAITEYPCKDTYFDLLDEFDIEIIEDTVKIPDKFVIEI